MGFNYVDSLSIDHGRGKDKWVSHELNRSGRIQSNFSLHGVPD